MRRMPKNVTYADIGSLNSSIDVVASVRGSSRRAVMAGAYLLAAELEARSGRNNWKVDVGLEDPEDWEGVVATVRIELRDEEDEREAALKILHAALLKVSGGKAVLGPSAKARPAPKRRSRKRT